MIKKVLVLAPLIASINFGYLETATAATPTEITATESLAQLAVSGTPTESKQAIAALRELGPKGLQVFLATHQDRLKSSTLASAPELRAVLDTLCQQRDCYASHLYWYTDLAQAKAAAKASGKPILSLRLLGRLDEELSCANSRFFRIALYANGEVSEVLRDRFILHWESVRPAPKVTIDFGDGRRLQRTLTGNSIHYILDAEGRPIDALPGLYSPKAFLKHLLAVEKIADQSSKLAGLERENYLSKYHRDAIATIQANWTADLSKLGLSQPLPKLAEVSQESPLAEVAAPLAVSKAVVEMPIISAISLNRQALQQATDDATWAKIAQMYVAEASLDSNSLALIRSKNPNLDREWRSLATNPDKNSLPPAILNFERSIALDTVRNEYLFRFQLHQWFLEEPQTTANIDSLNERVYAELFQTPSSDPWLGLLPSNTYTGIENDGLTGRDR